MSKKFLVLQAATIAFTLGAPKKGSAHPEEFSLGGKAKTKVKVTMVGSLRAGDVKNASGEYAPEAFGFLTVIAGKTKSASGVDYIAATAGGLRGAFFKTKKEGSEILYAGIMEKGDGTEYPVFARERTGKDGKKFLSFSSKPAQEKDAARGRANKPETGASRAQAQTFEDGDIPF